MEKLYVLFGHGNDLNTPQMCLRAVVIFMITLALIRISGRRSFAMKSPFDNVTVILLGALLSRTIVGASAFIPTVAAALVIVLMHRIFSWLSVKTEWFGQLTKGKKLILYEDGKLSQQSMDNALVNKQDLQEQLRIKTHSDNFKHIERVYMERSGEISFIKEPPKTSDKPGGEQRPTSPIGKK